MEPNFFWEPDWNFHLSDLGDLTAETVCQSSYRNLSTRECADDYFELQELFQDSSPDRGREDCCLDVDSWFGSDSTASEETQQNAVKLSSFHPSSDSSVKDETSVDEWSSDRVPAGQSHRRRLLVHSSARRGHQRQAANVRERRRMKTINEAFEGLRARIPLSKQGRAGQAEPVSKSNAVAADRKLSKVDTLRLAIRYIRHLVTLVNTTDSRDVKFDCSTPGNRSSLFDDERRTVGDGSQLPVPRVFIRHHFADGENSAAADDGYPVLLGHSLSWEHRSETRLTTSGRLRAKIWTPSTSVDSDSVDVDMTILTQEREQDF